MKQLEKAIVLQNRALTAADEQECSIRTAWDTCKAVVITREG